MESTLLHGVRVLELSQPQTMLAGQILADLGADVIVIEPPAAHPVDGWVRSSATGSASTEA